MELFEILEYNPFCTYKKFYTLWYWKMLDISINSFFNTAFDSS